MKIQDVSKLQGKLKLAILTWGNNKIDDMLPSKPTLRVALKNGLNNIMSRYDGKISHTIESLFLFAGNEKGEIDTDIMVDSLSAIFKEMDVGEYKLGSIIAKIGKGEASFQLPKNMFVELLAGNIGSIVFNCDDIEELKNIINN